MNKVNLSPEQLEKIIHLRLVEKLDLQVIAKRFGVGVSRIHRIARGKK